MISHYNCSEALDPEITGYPDKVEPKNPLDDEIMKKFLQQDSIEEKEVTQFKKKFVQKFIGTVKYIYNKILIKVFK